MVEAYSFFPTSAGCLWGWNVLSLFYYIWESVPFNSVGTVFSIDVGNAPRMIGFQQCFHLGGERLVVGGLAHLHLALDKTSRCINTCPLDAKHDSLDVGQFVTSSIHSQGQQFNRKNKYESLYHAFHTILI